MAAVVVPAALCLINGTNVGLGMPGAAAALPVIAGVALAAAGLRLMAETISLFAHRGRGTLAPWDPTRRLVVEGPYRRVRNPMISGVFTVLVGEAIVLGTPALFVWVGGFALVNAVYMPLFEEPGLARRFGEDYMTYKRNVPRWIPRRTPWVSTLGLVLAAVLFVHMQAPALAAEPEGTVAHSLSQSPGVVRDYWTPERMREADAIAPLGTPSAAASGVPVQTPYSQAPDLETNPALDTAYPQRLHGILFVSFGTANGSCSATLVTSRNRSVILTAGHCVVQPAVEGSSPPIWATNVLFVPGYRNGVRPLGSYAATSERASFAWVVTGDLGVDVGAITLAPLGGVRAEDALGSRGVSFNRTAKSYRKNRTRLQIFGYPAEPSAFYDGERLIVCDTAFAGFQKLFGSPLALCNMKEGSSGGGWVLKGGLVNSVVSHNPCGISPTCTRSAGTYFGDIAFKLWSAAGGGIAKGRQKRVDACKRKRGGKKAACIGRAETFKPTVR